MKDGEIHTMALLGTIVLSAGLIVPTVWFTAAAGADDGPKLDNMTMIEASLAVKKTTKVVQPQKEFKQPEPVKQEGVSHDDKKPPPDEPKKKDEPKKPTDDKAPDLSKFHHANDDDQPVGKLAPVQIGDLNGSEFGDSAKSVGDPWLGQLRADMHFNPPEIAKGDSVPIGCLLLTPDGKITDTRFKAKTDDDLQTAAEAALAQLVKSRNEHPIEVPTQLLQLTQHYICFHFRVKQS